jgi:hypothetical protein
MILAASIVLSVAAAAQEPPAPPPRRRVRSQVTVVIEESPTGDYEHDYYEQPWPVELRSGAAGAESRVTFRSACRPQEEDRAPIFLPPPAVPRLPLSLSLAVGMPKLTVTSTSDVVTSTVGGRSRTDPIISTKPALFGGGGGSGSVTSSDAPFLYGPELDLVVASDLAAWTSTRWLPDGTSLRLYGRALFGTLEVFDTPTDLQLYGLGPRLSVPLLRASSFQGAVTVSAGPAFLRTGIGDALGFDGGIGLRVEQFFGPAFSLVGSVEANLYFSENVTAFGPVVNLGFNLSW